MDRIKPSHINIKWMDIRNDTVVPSGSSPWGTLRQDGTFPNQRVTWTNVSLIKD